MNNKIVKRYPLSKQVSDKLEQMIEAGEYGIGDKIPTEIELMELFQVSRNTIREAIQSLTSAGVLIVKQGDGTYVRSSNRFNANMSMRYAEASLEDIKEARNALEITIAPLAAKRRTEEDMAKITETFMKRQGLKDTLKENTVADVEFHMAIASACHNKIIFDLYHSIYSFLESHIAERHVETEMDADAIDALHEELYMAIKNQNPDVANTCAQNILRI